MKYLTIVIIVLLMGLLVIGFADCGGDDDNDDCDEKVHINVDAVTHSDRSGTVWYYVSKGKKGFYIKGGAGSKGEVVSSLCPGQSIVLIASFDRGEANDENTQELTYEEALLGAEPKETYQRDTTEYITQGATYIYHWQPKFDL